MAEVTKLLKKVMMEEKASASEYDTKWKWISDSAVKVT